MYFNNERKKYLTIINSTFFMLFNRYQNCFKLYTVAESIYKSMVVAHSK